MESIIKWFENADPVLGALVATTFTWLMTATGAAFILLFKSFNRTVLDGLLGFTGGVMVSASFWSLLTPSIAMTVDTGFLKVMPAATGFLLGALFVFGIDKTLPHLHINFEKTEGRQSQWSRTTLLVLAITLHNIPEGLAIGVLFGGVAAGIPEATMTGALILTMGIAIQNLPEGLAVAVPLRRMGMSRKKSFLYGQASAIVEPIAGVIGALFVHSFAPILPYALAFAAGAMIFVVIEEVIPETQLENNTDIATMGFILGFTLMMILDVGLS